MISTRAVLAYGTIKDFDWHAATVSVERRKKAESYRFEDDKKRCILSEALLRKALSAFGIKIDDISYRYNEHGKPFLKDYSDIYFSISHSKDYVVCILSNAEIGIDIEYIEDINLNVAKRFFAESEYKSIMSSETKAQRLDKFYDCWTKKEAYIKWTGKGLACPLDSFDVYSKLDCDLKTLDKFDGYKCAICTQSQISILEILSYINKHGKD